MESNTQHFKKHTATVTTIILKIARALANNYWIFLTRSCYNMIPRYNDHSRSWLELNFFFRDHNLLHFLDFYEFTHLFAQMSWNISHFLIRFGVNHVFWVIYLIFSYYRANIIVALKLLNTGIYFSKIWLIF